MTPRARIEDLVTQLRARLPRAVVTVDEPTDPEGHWFVDVVRDGWRLVIDYSMRARSGSTSFRKAPRLTATVREFSSLETAVHLAVECFQDPKR